VKIPAGKGSPPAGSRSCVAFQQRVLRSVDSKQMGRVIEPRKGEVAGVDESQPSEDSISLAGTARGARSRRGQRAGHVCKGSLGTWESHWEIPGNPEPEIPNQVGEIPNQVGKSRTRLILGMAAGRSRKTSAHHERKAAVAPEGRLSGGKSAMSCQRQGFWEPRPGQRRTPDVPVP